MRIYWINPTISTNSIYADTGWMELSSSCRNHEWIEPIIDWGSYSTVESIVNKILGHNPDMVCFSSYIWNEQLEVDIVKSLKQKRPDIITVRGGPNQTKGFEYFNYSNLPLDAGEPFMVKLLNELTGDNIIERTKQFPEESSIMYNMSYMISVASTAKSLNKNSVFNLETTRGCPYSCTYCEWGGGIGTKIFQKPLKNVYEEIDLCSSLKIDEIDISDANFGILPRDVHIMQKLVDNKNMFGYPKSTMIYGITKNKVEKKLAIYEIAAKGKMMDAFSVPIQSMTETVKKNIKRTDTPLLETLQMCTYLKDTYGVNPRLELIMGLPGSTLEDFYNEYDLVEYVKNWVWTRYPFSLLSATEAATPFYRRLHKIKTALVPLPLNDCDMSGNADSDKPKSIVNTFRMEEEIVVEANGYTRTEWVQMFFMNYAQVVIGPRLPQKEKASIEMRKVWEDLQDKKWFQYLIKEIDKLSLGNRPEEDFLHYDGMNIQEWVKHYYYDGKQYDGI